MLACVAAVSIFVLAADDAHASKEKFVRNKPHVNVAAPHGLSNEALTASVGVVEPGAIGIGLAASKPCRGEVDLRIEDALSGASLASRLAVPLRSGVFESVSYASPTASIAARVVIVARDMEVDGKECVLRGAVEVQDLVSGQVSRRIPIRRGDFVLLKRAP